MSSRAATGTVLLDVDAPTPTVALVRVLDATGAPVLRRRVRDRRVALTLPEGRHRVTVTDERRGHDPAHLAGTTLDLVVTAGAVVRTSVALGRGAVARVATTAWAPVAAVHAEGERLE